MPSAPTVPDMSPLRCPACGAPVNVDRQGPGQTSIVCDYCGAALTVAGAPPLPPTLRLASRGRWMQGGWAGDPRVWGVFVLLLLGLVALLVFGDFGPR